VIEVAEPLFCHCGKKFDGNNWKKAFQFEIQIEALSFTGFK
jgi:hypothetical protein